MHLFYYISFQSSTPAKRNQNKTNLPKMLLFSETNWDTAYQRTINKTRREK